MTDVCDFQPTENEIRHLIARRQEWENNAREYRRFHNEYDLQRYNERWGYHFFEADSMRFFNSKIGLVYSGNSPADWNIFITSERDKWCGGARRYTVRQLHIDGSVEDLSKFQQYATSAQARRAVEKYLQDGTPFRAATE